MEELGRFTFEGVPHELECPSHYEQREGNVPEPQVSESAMAGRRADRSPDEQREREQWQ